MKLSFDTRGNEKQKQCVAAWINPDVVDIVYGGSKGSAKSFTGCSLIFGDALIYPETHYFIARKKLNDLRKFTIPSIYEVFDIWGLTPDYYKYNGQDNYFELHNGSKVFLLEAKYYPTDPLFTRFGSMQMTRGWIEEAGEFEEAAKNNLMASIGRWKNDVYKLSPKLLQTCNPSKNYLYRNYYKKHKEGTLEPWRTFIQALPTDNKMLPSGYLDNLNRTLTKNEKERLLYGNWEFDDDPATLMSYDKIMDIWSNNHVLPGEKYISSDIARLGGDRIVIVEWDGFRGRIKAHKKQGLDVTGKMIEETRARLKAGKSSVIVDEDGVGGGVVDFMKYKGFVNNARPLNNENYDNLKSQCYFKLADLVNENGLYLQCDDEIKELVIEELEQVKQKNMDSDMKKGVIPKEKVKELLGRSPDFADAIMMRMWFDLAPKKSVTW